ncbi:hypothetical protein N7457_008331 [Penicillium paradoxum]|uniref:uncharacterized protein n=1 Tax=Penicillium paradoxum TaxID=176176 RepID=UPI0025486258|nr:uncharacterized protein N7457_008331 [Penicillium paradoxum]KAJ5773435.1 hypothetical protein N7457_008331 [Penicillium paradoxum]
MTENNERADVTVVQREVPLIDPSNHDFKGERSQWAIDYETACEDGQLATVQSMVSSRKQTLLFLHPGLAHAPRAGQVEVAHYLLSVGAPIYYVRRTIQGFPSSMFSHSKDEDRCHINARGAL